MRRSSQSRKASNGLTFKSYFSSIGASNFGFHIVRRSEHDDSSGRDWRDSACLRIASYALTLVKNAKRAEVAKRHFPFVSEGRNDFFEDGVDQPPGVESRKAGAIGKDGPHDLLFRQRPSRLSVCNAGSFWGRLEANRLGLRDAFTRLGFTIGRVGNWHGAARWLDRIAESKNFRPHATRIG